MEAAINSLWLMRGEIITAFWQTCVMVGISTAVSVVIGGLLGVLLFVTADKQMLANAGVHHTVGQTVNFIRAFPFVILMIALIPATRLVVGTSIGPLAASLVLSVAGLFYFSRLVEQNLREVPRGVLEAADAMGTPPLAVMVKVLLTEARSGLVLSVTILMITLLSSSAAAGMIGGGGLGDLAIRYGYYRYQTEVIVFIVALLSLMVVITQSIGNRIAAKLDKR
ncbi:MAG: methionine ABC transporter permease [Neisseria sp.]|nr:methionine ABC transporter permease [Neisseria sp.]